MASTLAELTARVRSMLPDADGDFVTDSDIENFINEAYLDIADRIDGVEQEFTGTVSGNTITLPPSGATSIKRVESLRIDDEEVVFVDDATFNSYLDADVDPDFTIARVFDQTVELLPDADGDYVLRCVIIPAAMTASDTQELPVWCERKLVDFGCYRGLVKMDEMRRAESFIATYEQGLPAPTIGKDRGIPGPLTLAPMIGTFDIDPDAKHI